MNRISLGLAAGLATAMASILALPSRAQEADSVRVLDAIVIEEQRDDERSFPGALTLRLDALSAQAAPDAARLLDHVPGMHVRRSGTTGAAFASFRGLGAASTRIEFEGIRLVDPATGSFDLSLFPPALIGSLSVMSGTAAGSVPGGRIALGVPEVSSARASFRGGAFGYREVAARAGQAGTHSSISALASVSDSDGSFRYRHPVWMGHPVVRREGADRRHAAALVHVRRDTRPAASPGSSQRGAGAVFRAMVLATHVDRSLPPLSISSAAPASQQDDLLLAGVQVQTQWSGMPVRASLSTTHSRFQYRHPSRDTTRVVLGQIALRGRIDRVLSARWTAAVEPSLALSRTATEQQHHIIDGALRMSMGHVRETWMVGAFIDARHRSTRTSLRPSSETAATLAPGLWWTHALLPGLESRIAVARVLRLPTLNERYWVPGGNPALRAERGMQAEWMLSYRPGEAVHLRVVTFLSRLKERIVWRPIYLDASRQIWTPDNVALVEGRGLEAYVHWSPFPSTNVTISGTRRTQRDRSNPSAASYGHQLRFVAPWSIHGTLEWQYESVGFFGTWHHTARRYTATDGSLWMPAYRVVDAGMVWHAAEDRFGLDIRLTASNLFNEAYESAPWMPMPGRSWRLEVVLGP